MSLGLNTATIIAKKWLTSKILEITLKPIKPELVSYQPGQFISVKVNNVNFRAYSLAGNCAEKTTMTLVVAAGHIGAGADFFRNSEIGTEVKYVGPRGKFVLEESINKKLVFFATGTGLAPFIPMLHQLQERRNYKNIQVIFGVRTESEMFYKDLLNHFAEKMPNFSYKICFSQQNTQKQNTAAGRITAHIPEMITESKMPKIFNPIIKRNILVYACGNPNMINDLKAILAKNNLPKNNLFTEKFTIPKRNSSIKG